MCINLTSDPSSVHLLAVFQHREVGQEASHDWGLCHDGHLQCWNHIGTHFAGVCFCVFLFVCVCVCNQNREIRGTGKKGQEVLSRLWGLLCELKNASKWHIVV